MGAATLYPGRSSGSMPRQTTAASGTGNASGSEASAGGVRKQAQGAGVLRRVMVGGLDGGHPLRAQHCKQQQEHRRGSTLARGWHYVLRFAYPARSCAGGGLTEPHGEETSITRRRMR